MSQQGFSGSSEAPGPETALSQHFSAVHRVPRLVSRILHSAVLALLLTVY